MVADLSNLGFWDDHDETSSVPEFEKLLKVYLSSDQYDHKWVFWRRPKVHHPLSYGPTVQLPSLGSISWIENNKYKIKRMLEKMTECHPGQCKYLVQFWVLEPIDHHLYLTAADQPFAVGLLCKGILLYRQWCMAHRYRVDKGAQEGELGVVGRVFRNMLPESTPDLRLYSSHEFPLRDVAAGCGLRSLLALPVVDSLKEKCYGVIEVYYSDFGDMITYPLEEGLKAAKLSTTHTNLGDNLWKVAGVFGITKMLEAAVRAMPQLQIAQAWTPCFESSNTSYGISCMQRAAFVNAVDGKVNSYKGIDEDMCNYLKACDLHSLPVGEHKNMIAAVMSSNNKSCICRNVCHFSISENPLVHYAQKARVSSCFAICLQSKTGSDDVCVVEFFLQFNSRGDEIFGSFVSLLLRIMEMELKSFEVAYRGHQGEELALDVYKGNKIPYALRNESVKFKHQHFEEHSMLMSTKGHKRLFVLSDFKKYLENDDLHCLQPSEGSKRGWVFWSQVGRGLLEEVNSNSSLVPNPIHEKVKLLMREITSTTAAYSLAQFWAPKFDGDRCYLETSGQPFAFGCLYRGLADFRKQCMENRYFVDEGAKEEELGPLGRVFLKGHLEFTPDLRLYSPTEFPLRNHAINCCLRKYLVLPLFDLKHYKCVGVLELIDFTSSALEVIGIALGAANLSSSHINFSTSLQGSLPLGNNVECWKLALTEIEEACKLFEEIPQLFMMEVWVSQNKCPIKSNTLSCMERVWAPKSVPELDMPMCRIQCVEAGKGIAGMAIASENMSCFCPHSYEFSIADQPLAHLVSRARLSGCFAICLQSSHTGELLYLLQFYLNQGRGEYENLRSFLCLLLPKMKQKLKSFKAASRQQRGPKLLVEVIEPSEVNEFASSKISLPDNFPIEFKLVKYGGKNHSKVAQAPEESVTSVAEAEHNIAANTENLETHPGQKRKDAADALDIGESTLKRTCTRGNANESARENLPLHQDVPLGDPKSLQDVIVMLKMDTVVIYAKHENKTIKFKLSNSAGMEKLANEVATRLKLEVGSFEMEYLDEINEKIMLTCDADMELCIESLAAVGKPYVQVFVRSIKI